MTQRDDFESQLKDALNSRRDALAADTLSRLRQARHRALGAPSEHDSQRRSPWPRWAGPSTALASLLGVTFGLSVWIKAPPGDDIAGTIDMPPPALVEMATNDVDIELLEEIEFYDWLLLLHDDGDSA